MKKSISAILLFVPFVFTAAAEAADWIMECPAQLATTQSVSGQVAQGWSPIARTRSAVHDAKGGAATTEATPPVGISVFDGPPENLVELVPDNPNAQVIQWTFAKDRARDIHIVCHYADTRVGLARRAPPTVTSCALSVIAAGVVCK